MFPEREGREEGTKEGGREEGGRASHHPLRRRRAWGYRIRSTCTT